MIERKAALLSAPRTGSTMITRTLYNHPQAYFIGAIFSRKGWDGAGPGQAPLSGDLGKEWDDLEYRIENRDALMQRLYDLDIAPCIGFKHHLSNDRRIVESVLADKSIAKIVLTRPNMLATFSSNVIARAKTATPVSETPPNRLPFDADEFLLHIKRRNRMLDHWKPQIEAVRDRCLQITYSEARTDQGMARIVDFLGLEPAELKHITVKRNSDRVVERFTDPDAVMAFLAQQGMEDWAEENEPLPV